LVPSLRLIVAGDVVYNNTHMYLAESTTASRQARQGRIKAACFGIYARVRARLRDSAARSSRTCLNWYKVDSLGYGEYARCAFVRNWGYYGQP
jgi:hypothetical protein